MKKTTKLLLICGAVFLCLGATLFMTAFYAVGWDIEKLSTDRHEWATQTVTFTPEETAGITSIDATDDLEINVEGYDGNTVKISYFGGEKRDFDAHISGQTLTVKGSHIKENRFKFFSVDETNYRTVIYVPRTFTGNINVTGLGNGAAVAGFAKLQQVEVSCKFGMSSLSGVTAATAQVESKNGMVSVDHSTIAAALDVSANNGLVQIGDTQAAQATITATNGAITAKNVLVAGQLSVESSLGEVDLYHTNAAAQTIRCSHGVVSLTLAGKESDYDIRSDCSYGDAQAPRGSAAAERKVWVSVTYGSIDIQVDGTPLGKLQFDIPATPGGDAQPSLDAEQKQG